MGRCKGPDPLYANVLDSYKPRELKWTSGTD